MKHSPNKYEAAKQNSSPFISSSHLIGKNIKHRESHKKYQTLNNDLAAINEIVDSCK